MWGTVRHWLHQPHVTITAARFNSAVFLVVTQYYILIATHFTYPGGMEARVERVGSRDRTRTFCTHERTCIGPANALTNWTSQTDESSGNWLPVITSKELFLKYTGPISRMSWDVRVKFGLWKWSLCQDWREWNEWWFGECVVFT